MEKNCDLKRRKRFDPLRPTCPAAGFSLLTTFVRHIAWKNRTPALAFLRIPSYTAYFIGAFHVTKTIFVFERQNMPAGLDFSIVGVVRPGRNHPSLEFFGDERDKCR